MVNLKTTSCLLLSIIILIGINFYVLNKTNTGKTFTESTVLQNGDAGHYYQIAQNIYNFSTYSDTNSTIPSQTATWRPPFWPLVLSTFLYFTSNPFWLIVCKILLESFIIITVLALVKKKLNLQFKYFLPFLLLLVEPQRLKYSVTFLSESFSAVLILLICALFVLSSQLGKYKISIPILASVIVLCHPVSVFFILLLFAIYLLTMFKNDFKTALFHGVLFATIVLSWPIRNLVTFKEGLYLTASQGATFSKGWNDKVTSNFTNVDGDLADESLNLKYIDAKLIKPNRTVLQTSALYKKATNKYIESLNFNQKRNIILTKIKSNFLPYPEKLKPGFLEYLSIFFRFLYLFVFLQMLYYFLKGKIQVQTENGKIMIVILAVFIGQILMSAYVYTGLRFNSIFGLALLFTFLYLNSKAILNFILNILLKLKSENA